MKSQVTERMSIPEEVTCIKDGYMIKVKKGSSELAKKIDIPGTNIKIQGNEIIFECKKANKNDYKKIKSAIAHLKNLFDGLDKEYVYKLEACNVHFPMTLKVEAGKILINNFLGEKTPRKAVILPNVNVVVKGPQITVSSHDREAAGQTAANFEKATKIRNRDRRVFQDGIFLVERPGREI